MYSSKAYLQGALIQCILLGWKKECVAEDVSQESQSRPIIDWPVLKAAIVYSMDRHRSDGRNIDKFLKQW